LIDLAEFGLTGEPLVQASVPVADLVVFSGDKLVGGPQAGCIVGRRAAVGRLKRNPFARALRADKLTLAALEATLRLYRDPIRARAEIPVLRMLTADPGALRDAASRLASAIAPHFSPTLEPGVSAVGGGSFPEAVLPTTLVRLDPGPAGAHGLALKLRLGQPSILARVQNGAVVLDPRTMGAAERDEAAAAIRQLATEA
jgi:L-seryl-tRNA(Ser) seleniumtransferase